MGEPTIETQSLPDAESVVISKQYIGGSLFKSQNGSIWTPSQFEDLKFTLYKADFSKSRDAEVIFYNPELNYESSLIPTLKNNAIRTLPRKMKVKIDTGATASEIAVGKRIGAGVAGVANTTPNGIVERLGGVVSGESLEAGGSGYKASLSGQTASTFNITGNGTGLTLNVSSGFRWKRMTGAAINAAGSGYSVGDLVGIVTSTLGAGQQSGSGAVFSIDSISATDTLYLTDVQGQTFSNNAALLHFNGTNFVALTGNKQVDGTVNTPIDALHAGNVIEISHYNHGMHSGNNKLEISNIQPTTSTCYIKCCSWIIHKCITT